MAADMKRIERLLSEQRSAGDGAGNGRAETPEQAIRAAMKRAARAGDADAESRLRDKLKKHKQDVRAAAAVKPEPVAQPEPVAHLEPVAQPELVAAVAPPPEPAPAEPARAPAQEDLAEVTIVGTASMTGTGNVSAAEADSVAVTLIRSAIERAQAKGDAAEVARLQAKLERERTHS
jgi:hypothetical protein